MCKLHTNLLKYKEQKLTYFAEQQFLLPHYAREVLSPMPGVEKFNRERIAVLQTDVPPELRVLYQSPLLTREQEYHLFRKFNYWKYQAKQLLDVLGLDSVTEVKLRHVERCLAEASATKHLIVSCNTRLVGNLAKRQYEYIQNQTLDMLLVIISDGSVGLTRAVDYFDYRRRLKFSTYATWAVIDTIKKGRSQRNKHVDRMLTDYDDVLYQQVDGRREPEFDFSDRDNIKKLVSRLAPRNQEVIERYFGLLGEPENLEKIGLRLQLSKERVRQIKEESLANLRSLAGVG